MDKIINGTEIKNKKIEFFQNEINNISDRLKLAVIQVGNDPASDVYIKNKRLLCEEVGIEFLHLKYGFISEEELISVINDLNSDNTVTGVLVQLPLPDEINADNVINSIHPLKDVDGLSVSNVGALFSGEDGLYPCTALGVMEALDSKNINLEGLNVVIVGRSKLVGLPLISLLLKRNATVTVCHSKTNNLKDITSQADILIIAVGKKHLITEEYVKEGATVIDVGINREDKLYGDCDFDSIIDKCKYITPVPGGIGPLTITMLIGNIIKAYNLQKK